MNCAFKTGPKHRQRFLCEVRINEYPYVGAGNSTNKKDAERNAARDFVNFLVRSGTLSAADIPSSAIDGGAALPARAPEISSAPVFSVSKIILNQCNLNGSEIFITTII